MSTAGLAVIDQLNDEYGEGAPRPWTEPGADSPERQCLPKGAISKAGLHQECTGRTCCEHGTSENGSTGVREADRSGGKSTIIKPGGEVKAPANFRPIYHHQRSIRHSGDQDWVPKGADRFCNSSRRATTTTRPSSVRLKLRARSACTAT